MNGTPAAAFHWTDVFTVGLAIIVTLLGWVWHAARLASKVDQMSEQVRGLTHRLDKHLCDEEGVWQETRDWRDAVMEKLSRTREDVARLESRQIHRHRLDDDDE